MDANLNQGLMLTVIGMALVFGSLAMLWGLMALMGRVLDRQPPEGGDASSRPPDELAVAPVLESGDPLPSDEEMAAIAIALVTLRSEHEAEVALGWRLPPVLTRWLAVGYGRQLHTWQPRRTKRDA